MKVLKRIWKITRVLLLVLLLLAVGTYYAIKLPRVQTWLTHAVANYLSGELGTTVSVGEVDIDLWAKLVIKDLYIEDQHQDTLAWIPELRLGHYSLDRKKGVMEINNVTLLNPVIKLKRYTGEEDLNLQFIVDYFKSPTDTTDTSSTIVFINNFAIQGGQFSYENQLRESRGVPGLDWNHLKISDLNLELCSFSSIGDSLYAEIGSVSGKDISGFSLVHLQSELISVPGSIKLNKANIQTPGSNIQGDLSFKINSIDDLDFFEERVKMNHVFEESKIQLGDIAYFSSDLWGIDKVITLEGKVKGTIANLKGRDLAIGIDDLTYFRGNFDMQGLPKMDETFISLDIKEFTTNKIELDRIPLPPFDSLNYLKTPENFAKLGQVDFKGNFTGFVNDFVAYGQLHTAIGDVSTDISLREDSLAKNYFFNGKLSTNQFNLGEFYSENKLGAITSDLKVSGSGLNIDKLDATFDGSISQLYFNKYNYTDIDAQGTFRKKFFKGSIEMYDPNAQMSFDGQMDFSKPDPVLSFEADLHHVDLKEIHLLSDQEYSSLSGKIIVDSKGLSLDKLVGTVHLDDIDYCTKDKEYFIEHIDLSAIRTPQLEFTLESDIASGELKGNFDVRELGASFSDIISNVIPSFIPPQRAHKTQQFELTLNVHDFSEVSGIFIPDLHIAPRTRVDLIVDEPRSFFELVVSSDSVSYMGNEITSLVVDARRPDESLYITINSDLLTLEGGMEFEQFAIDARSNRDTVYTAIAWGTDSTAHSGDITGRLAVHGYSSYDFLFDQSSLKVNGDKWQFINGSGVSIDSVYTEVHSLGLYNGDQSLYLEGCVSEYSQDGLSAQLNNFDLKSLNPFIGGDMKLYGTVTGTAHVQDIYQSFIFTNDLTIQGFKLNEYLFGNMKLESRWDNALRRLRLDGELEKENAVPLKFAGYYNVDNKESPLDVVATIQNLNLSFINEFLEDGILDIFGFASGTIAITGKPDAPQMEGEASLKGAGIFVDYLNTKFSIEDRIGVYPDMFTFDHVRIRDQEGNPGFLTGTIMHKDFSEWNFDVIADVETPMLCMNTNEDLNPLYYGKAYLTGSVGISGAEDQLEFDINVKSERGTVLAMPMNSTEDVSFENFIRFKGTGQSSVEDPLDLSGIKLNFQLDITPDAEFQIIFDQAVGDVMKGRGRGHLTMDISNLSTFNMYGNIEVTQGNYLFTLKNLLNKDFTIKPGGTISWFGDPFAGELNLQAVYKVTATLSEIIPDATKNNGARVPVDLIMGLNGKMFNPGIDFNIVLPTVDQVTRSRIESVISTDQERNRQAFSLLVLRRFVSPPNITNAAAGSFGIKDNSSELLSSQISNWLSQISSDFNLGFNYRPGDEISSQEIALALSTQLFNDRLSVSGNFGVARGNATNANPNNYIGDIRLEYKLTKEGKIKLVVYNESNDYRMATLTQSPYTQGVGILYQEEFDSMDQFYCGFKNMFTKKLNRIECD